MENALNREDKKLKNSKCLTTKKIKLVGKTIQKLLGKNHLNVKNVS